MLNRTSPRWCAHCDIVIAHVAEPEGGNRCGGCGAWDGEPEPVDPEQLHPEEERALLRELRDRSWHG
jgi:hypothetical protein